MLPACGDACCNKVASKHRKHNLNVTHEPVVTIRVQRQIALKSANKRSHLAALNQY